MKLGRLITLAVLVAILTPSARAEDSISSDVLQKVKRASVFVKVSLGPLEFTGSGFALQTEGQTVYLVTNEHVVAKPNLEGLGGVPFGLRGRQMLELRRIQLAIQNLEPEVSVVFNSGTKEEQVLKAEVLAIDKQRDLAILKVAGVRLAPQPIPLDTGFKPAETTSVFTFGFPFGEALSKSNGNPAITVGRGAVSSLRLDEQGEDSVVQIDGALNPGNSGGPVVDAKGRLVGVAVATIKGSGIGFAIPPATLQKMLDGRISSVKVISRPDQEAVAVDITLTLLDPFRKIREIAVHCVPGNVKTPTPIPQKPLDGGEKLELIVKDGKATGTWNVPKAAGKPAVVSLQPAYIDSEGKTVYLAATQHRLSSSADPADGPRAAGFPGRRPGVFGPRRPALDDGTRERVIAGFGDANKDALLRAFAELDRFDPGKGNIEIATALARLLGHRDEQVRTKAAALIAGWGSKDNAAAVTKALADTVAPVRHAAMQALALWKVAGAAEPIAERLYDTQDRSFAQQALIRMGPIAEAAVVKCLDDEELAVRLAACDILAQIGTKDGSVPALTQRSKDANGLVATRALEAIGKIASRANGGSAAPIPVAAGNRKVHRGSTSQLAGKMLAGGVLVLGERSTAQGLGVVQTGESTMELTYFALIRFPNGNFSRTSFVTRNQAIGNQARAFYGAYLDDESLTIEHAYASGKNPLTEEQFTIQDEKFDPAEGRLFFIDLSNGPPRIAQKKIDLPAELPLSPIDDAHLVDLADKTLDDLLKRSEDVRDFVGGGKQPAK